VFFQLKNILTLTAILVFFNLIFTNTYSYFKDYFFLYLHPFSYNTVQLITKKIPYNIVVNLKTERKIKTFLRCWDYIGGHCRLVRTWWYVHNLNNSDVISGIANCFYYTLYLSRRIERRGGSYSEQRRREYNNNNINIT